MCTVSKKYLGSTFNLGLKMEQNVECLLCKKAFIKCFQWWRKKKNVKFYEMYVCYPFTYLGPKEMGRKCVCILFSYKQKLT